MSKILQIPLAEYEAELLAKFNAGEAAGRADEKYRLQPLLDYITEITTIYGPCADKEGWFWKKDLTADQIRKSLRDLMFQVREFE